MADKERLDVLLVERNLVQSRDRQDIPLSDSFENGS